MGNLGIIEETTSEEQLSNVNDNDIDVISNEVSRQHNADSASIATLVSNGLSPSGMSPSDSISQWEDNRLGSVAKKDKLFEQLLANYIDDHKKKQHHKRILKIIFFVCIMMLLFAVTGFVVYMYHYALQNISENITAFITASATLSIELVVAFFKLPKIIAEYLFDKEEDKSFAKIINNMQNYNLQRSKKSSQNNNDIE